MLQGSFSSAKIAQEEQVDIIWHSFAPKCMRALALELSQAGTLMGMLVHEGS